MKYIAFFLVLMIAGCMNINVDPPFVDSKKNVEFSTIQGSTTESEAAYGAGPDDGFLGLFDVDGECIAYIPPKALSGECTLLYINKNKAMVMPGKRVVGVSCIIEGQYSHVNLEFSMVADRTYTILCKKIRVNNMAKFSVIDDLGNFPSFRIVK